MTHAGGFLISLLFIATTGNHYHLNYKQ